VLARWSLVSLCLPACLVSFEDYPLGDLRGGVQAEAGAGGTETPASGGSSAGQAPSTEGGATPEGGAPSTSDSVSAFDDFEHEDDVIFELDGRKGNWYVSNDGRGMQTPRAGAELLPSPIEPARESSTHALHTFGGPFFTWGALIGASLDPDGAYDLTGYRGIRLWVRSGAPTSGPVGPGAAKQVRLNFTTAATIAGGSCTVCNDHFGADVPLTAQWVQVDVPLASVKQTGFGRPQVALDLTAVVDLQLTFPANVSFDLWVDDIELYR